MTQKQFMIANVGNRNLRYRGKKFKDIDAAQEDFRAFTKKLWENRQAELAHLGLEILPTLIEAKKENLRYVALFYSDQAAENTRINQDTLYAALLIKELLTAHYPKIEVLLEELRLKVTDANALMRSYHLKLMGYRSRYGDHRFLILDAGGTPLQKSSLKITAEFVFKYEPEYEVYNVAMLKEGQSVLEPVEPVEYRRILEGEEARSLVENGYYGAAINVIYGGDRHEKNPLLQALAAAQSRMIHLWGDWKFYSEKLQKKLERANSEIPAFIATGIEQSDSALAQKLDGYLTAHQAFLVNQFFELAWFFLERDDYNNSVLNFHQGMEYYLGHVAQNALLKKPAGQPQNRKIIDFINNHLQSFPELELWLQMNNETAAKGMSARLLLTALQSNYLTNKAHQSIMQNFENCTIDKKGKNLSNLVTLRNKLVHEGRSITKSTLFGSDSKEKLVQFDYRKELETILSLLGGKKESITAMNRYCASKVTELFM